jgi:hypothetical protein
MEEKSKKEASSSSSLKATAPVPVPPVPMKQKGTQDSDSGAYSLWGFAEEERGSRDEGAYFYGAAGTQLRTQQQQVVGSSGTPSWKSLLVSSQGTTTAAAAAAAAGGRANNSDNECREKEEEEEEDHDTVMEAIWARGAGRYRPELECGICLSEPRHRAYGLLSSCNCVFCLKCITAWRREKEIKADTTRACPLCRETSYYIAPCYHTYTIVTNDNKNTVLLPTRLQGGEEEEEEVRKELVARLRDAKHRFIQRWLQGLKARVCKYYRYGDGGDGGSGCPHGSSCHFRHIDAEGNDVAEVKPRFLLSGAGGVIAAGDTGGAEEQHCNLMDYMDKSARGR